MMSLYDVCTGCKVHKGFFASYEHTWDIIQEKLINIIENHENYKVLVLGHSMGGAIGVLISMKLKELGHDVLGITMGQPMIGNQFFANYINQCFNLQEDTFNPEGGLIRIAHKNDPVVKLPIGDSYFIFDRYAHCSNEIFIDEEGRLGELPLLEHVMYCDGSMDIECSYGMSFTRENTEHLNYFRTMGKCGISFP